MTNHNSGSNGTTTIDDTDIDEGLERPKMFKVILHNDDFTPMDFVVQILQKVFHHDETEAHSTMMQVHQKGQAVAGVYTSEIAETKVAVTLLTAQNYEFPLQATTEPE